MMDLAWMDKEQWSPRYRTLALQSMQPTWNLAPKCSWTGCPSAGGVRAQVTVEYALLQCGFLPTWADPKGQKPNNARMETAASKPYFRKAWKTGRCLIPADGWYEWKVTDKVKQPYFIHRADDQPMLMAGLYETNLHAHITSFAILTTDADGDLREVHDRKPVVLSASAANQWINRE
jgi:putative SOS response-associated peptidase YedK